LLMFIKCTVDPCCAYKVKVSSVYEFSLILDHLEPNTSEQVNEKEKHEDESENVHLLPRSTEVRHLPL
jgi:hypothetical protein